MTSVSHELSLLTLNTFGVPFFLSLGRLARLAKELEQLDKDILCLQEIQQNTYAYLLEKRLTSYPNKAVFPHHFTPKGGLMTFSRLPINRQQFELYKDRGLRLLITISDWALQKGMLVSHLQVGELEIVIVNTHLNANYSGDWRRENRLAMTQHKQVQQVSQFLKMAPPEALIILCGDFNFPRTSFLYDELVTENHLIDPLQEDERPTYRPFPLVPSKWKISLDFILLRLPQGKEVSYQADIMPLEDTSQHHAIRRFLTDHNALTLKVNWQQG